MGKYAELIQSVLGGRSDANIKFSKVKQVRNLIHRYKLGVEEDAE